MVAVESAWPASENHRQPLVVALAALIGGIVLDAWLDPDWRFWLAGLGLGLAAWWLLARRGFEHGSALALVAAIVALGAAWHHVYWNFFPPDEVARGAGANSRPICLEAFAAEEPRRIAAPPFDATRSIPRGDESRLEVAIVAVRDGAQWRRASGGAMLRVDGHLLGVRPGDRLRIFAQLRAPTPALQPESFDARWFQRLERRLTQLSSHTPDAVQAVQRGPWWLPLRLLGDLRRGLREQLQMHVGGERAPLAATILLGVRDELDPQEMEAYFHTGTIHILSISGLHVGILAGVFFFVHRWGVASRRMALAGAALMTAIYAIVAYSEPPVLRATILVVGLCGALWAGRRAASFNVLAGAGLFVLLLNPTDLFRSGVQLSFAAAAVLIAIMPRLTEMEQPDALERLVAPHRKWWHRAWLAFVSWARLLFLAGLAVWIVTLPIALFHFHLVAPAALVLNVVLSLPVTLAMWCGFALLLLGWLVPPLGGVCGWGCDRCLALVDGVVAWSEQIPGGYFWSPAPPGWWLVLACVGLAAWWFWPAWRPSTSWSAALACGWCGVGFALPLAPLLWPDEPQLACTFVAVGHGTGVVLELPNGQTVLYDAGTSGNPASAARAVSSVLWARGQTHLDAIIISHADVDHYNGVAGILERFSAGVVYVSPVMFERETPALQQFRQAIVARGIPLRTIAASDRLAGNSGARLEILHPTAKGVLGSDNANSLVLLVEFAGRRLLLPGDLESPGLDDVMAEEPLPCDVVMAPHHGSSRSNPVGFAAWSTPRYVVISGGPEFDSEPVRRAYETTGAQVRHTAFDGATRLVLRARGVECRSWLRERW